ncbi:proline iminopeptidase [Sulfodiicoccus acidiphilus]|uniref:proline iminopeptidase n=1 Tax=Sulfodiicoccus acidiphilus TaxID=1670455 RepID=UPI001E32AE2D
MEEGFVNVGGIRLYYRLHGEGEPLVVLHGGPGGSLDYLEPLTDLVKMRVQVLLYDQFGCGRSEDPPDESYYTIDYGVEEVEGVRETFFGDRKVFLLGHSYGGALALAYALKYQESLKGLIVSSGLSSVPLTIREMRRLISQLPGHQRRAIEEHGEKGEFDHPDYVEAVSEFYRRHLLRVEPMPEAVKRTFLYTERRKTYRIMNGPNEFTITGTIRNWDVTERLDTIRVPTLITVGKYDEVTPKVAEVIRSKIRGSELVLFERSSHMAMWEERERYIEVLSDFIARTSAKRT